MSDRFLETVGVAPLFNAGDDLSTAPDTFRPAHRHDMKRQLIVLALLNLVAAAVGLAFARQLSSGQAEYPVRPIELVVPFSHGGGTDTFARIIEYAIRENDLLPQPLTVINRGGAGATIGSRHVKDSDPDGYTLMVLHDAMITAKYSGMVDYGPEAFEVVAGTGELGMVIAVAQDSPFETLDEVLKSAAARPETIRFGANLGALTHFAGMQLEQQVPGARFLFPQVGGGADRFGDLIGGHIDVTGFSIEEFHRFSAAGIRGVAYLGPERHPAAPDLPTALELGYDVVNTNMFFWWFPKGTPADRILVVQEALRNAMETEYVRGKLAEIHCNPVFLTGDALRERIAQAEERFANVVTRPPSVLVSLPALLSTGVGMLLIVVAVQWFLRSRPETSESTATEETETGNDTSTRDLVRASLCFGITLAYTVSLAAGVGYSLATIVFVPAIGSVLVPRARAPQIMSLLLTGQILGFGLDALFTKLFDVSLPS